MKQNEANWTWVVHDSIKPCLANFFPLICVKARIFLELASSPLEDRGGVGALVEDGEERGGDAPHQRYPHPHRVTVGHHLVVLSLFSGRMSAAGFLLSSFLSLSLSPLLVRLSAFGGQRSTPGSHLLNILRSHAA